MSKIKFLLKFGERKYLERLQQGHLYFSNAKRFHEIEEMQLIKGQGDRLEGNSIIATTNVNIVDDNKSCITKTIKNVNIKICYSDAEKIPVFCLFACYSDNCIENLDGTYRFLLPNDTIKVITKHFPKADTVAIIRKPDDFIDKVDCSIGTECKSDLVHYFNIIPMKTDNNQQVNDYDYMLFLTQDTPPTINNNGESRYTFYSDYIYRVLQCKDKFFEKEQEYRFILPKIKIDEPKEFDVCINSADIELKDLNDFFSTMQ